MRSFSRRAILPVLAATLGASAGGLSGMLPELRVASISSLKLAPSSKRIRVTHLLGRDLQSAVDSAASHVDGRATFEFAASSGWIIEHREATGIEVAWEDGGRIGTLTKIPVRDPATGAPGKIVHANAGTNVISGLAISTAGSGEHHVFQARHGAVSESSWIRSLEDGSLEIEWSDGRRTIVPRTMRPTAKGAAARAGLAALRPEIAQAPVLVTCQEVCTVVVSVGYVIVCTVESVLTCAPLCGPVLPCEFLCEAIMLVSCGLAAVQYADSICTLTCG